jgi:hypothetical protein
MARTRSASQRRKGLNDVDVLGAAWNARAAASVAEVQAAARAIQQLRSLPRHNFTQTDSASTHAGSDGVFVARAPRARPPIIYTPREAEENVRRTLRERRRKKLLGRRSSSLTPGEGRKWVRWVRTRPGGWLSRKVEADEIARRAKALPGTAPTAYFHYGLQRLYTADL